MSTASVYPENTTHAFDYAERLGYDAVEVMVSIDVVSQNVEKVRSLRDYHQIPVCAVHAPCLLITQRVWGTEPWAKLERSAKMAKELDADVVVVHPAVPVAARLRDRVRRGHRRPRAAYRHRLRGGEHVPVAGDLAARDEGLPTRLGPLRRSPTPTPRSISPTPPPRKSDPVAMAERLGDRLRHVHMTDGSGSPKDEHLVPGHGNQPCGPFLELLATRGFEGHIVVEINTRKAADREAREADLLEALAFSRLHFARRRRLTVSATLPA